MKVFDVSHKVDDSGEYVLGVNATGSHACYLIYGVMKPHEKGRTLKPGKGHEELILVMKGEFSVSGDAQAMLRQGQAIHLQGDETCLLENTTGEEAVYVISGGHAEHNHH